MSQRREEYRAIVKRCFDAMPRQQYGAFSTVKMSDLMAVKVPPPRYGDRWGPWVYRAPGQLRYEGEHSTGYYVDLLDCTTCAELLDTVFVVAEKRFMDREAIGHLVQALNDLIKPLEHLCSWGQDQGPFDVKVWLKARRQQEAS